MVDVIRNFQYKTAGRGKGVLGLKDLRPCRRPGEETTMVREKTEAPSTSLETHTGKVAILSVPEGTRTSHLFFLVASQLQVVVVLYDYTANPGNPGGFAELTVKNGKLQCACPSVWLALQSTMVVPVLNLY